MTEPILILVVCHDAGGARSVIPVARSLSQKKVRVLAAVAGPAIAIWKAECPENPAVTVPDQLTVADAVALLRKDPVGLLLSASGLFNLMEHTFRKAAQQEGIRSVSILDSWINYSEKFERKIDGSLEICRPNLVCVLDQVTYDGMITAGFDPQELVITGAPNLEASAEYVRSNGLVLRKAWRTEQELKDGDLVVTFFSDPFYWIPDGRPCIATGGLMAPDGTSLYGYTSLDVLGSVLDELQTACLAHDKKCQLILKPHPLEYIDSLRPVVEARNYSHVKVSLQTQGTAARWIAVADAVIGMMSIALLEASLAGKPSLSVQLDLLHSGAEDPCLGNRLSYTYPVFDKGTLRSAMNSLAAGHYQTLMTTPNGRLKLHGAADNVAEVVLAQMNRENPGAKGFVRAPIREVSR